MIFPISLILVGFVLLILGANWLVDGASALARKFNIPDLVIGLTIVAFGTSAPELVVNVFASIQGHSDIVLGNIIGSNNFNLFAILGIVGLIFPITVKTSTVWNEIPISLLVAVILLLLGNSFNYDTCSVITRMGGFILLSLFAVFIWLIYRQMKLAPQVATNPTAAEVSNMRLAILITLGLAGLIAGGKLVVNNAVEIASQIGISEKVIGLTIVAAGTSLPELVTSVVAAFKKNADIAIGNIIGSNIFNILFILSISAIIKPIHYTPSFNIDLFLLICGTIFLFGAMFTGKKKKLDRWESALLLISFIIYTVYLIKR